MQLQKDYQIRDVGRTVVVLRSDLTFTPQPIGGKPGYVIEDPVNAKYYRIGISEYKFISLLDGSMTVADAMSATAVTLSDQAFSQQEAATICKWLVDTGLAHTRESSQAGRLAAAAEKADRAGLLQQINPMYVRLPLLQPDRVLDFVLTWMGWLHGPVGWVLTSILGIVACSQLMVHWDRFLIASDGILAPNRWLWLGMAWLLLKVVHEVSHGVVCKRYGGSVPELGVMLVLFAPLAYVDVTSSWRFRSKWERIHTAAAGIYVELLIASVAATIWSHSAPGMLNDACFNLIIMASLTTLLFNANPLMRFDGYYILSDLLELPNLYANGQQYVRYLACRYLLGMPRSSARWPAAKGAIIKTYGVAAFVWRVMVHTTLAIAAATMFAGAGIVIAVLATALWLGPTSLQIAKTLLTDPTLTSRNRIQFFASSGAILTLVVLSFTVIPWPGVVRAPAIVEYAPMAVVRAESPGFLQEIKVSNNQLVTKGEVLAILVNDELILELSELELDIQDSGLLCRSHQKNKRLAAYQAELKRRESLEKKRQQKKSEVDQLTVRSPINGQILARNLDLLRNNYVQKGAEIFSIGNQQAKEVKVSVAQEDLDAFSRHITMPVMLRLSGVGRFSTVLESVSPRASTEPFHAALCAPNGGPLAVRSEDNASDGNQAFQLLTPRFPAVVALQAENSSRLHAGQCGVASFWDGSDTIGRHLYRIVSRWTRAKLEQAQAVSRRT